jgi:hypothetical protein
MTTARQPCEVGEGGMRSLKPRFYQVDRARAAYAVACRKHPESFVVAGDQGADSQAH